jgi:hypothetical protein
VDASLTKNKNLVASIGLKTLRTLSPILTFGLTQITIICIKPDAAKNMTKTPLIYETRDEA